MYSRFQLAKKILRYYLTASNGNGHGIHSPFVFDFITNVLRDRKQYDCYQPIEELRKQLRTNQQVIDVVDFGAGSSLIKTNQRVIKDIAASSLKPAKYAQLLHRIAKHYHAQTIVELGTSFGITTAYLATGNTSSKVYTCEGAKSIASVARANFAQLQLKNIELIEGDFAITTTPLFSAIPQLDLAFIDGNHRKEPTLSYFQQLLNISHKDTLLIFDDIHWSADMEDAWETIRQHPRVTLTIDLFFIGIVCINSDIKEKQDFVISY